MGYIPLLVCIRGFDIMLVRLRSPKGGRPIREWYKTLEKGEPNLRILERAEDPVITEESLYCVKIGYYEDGSSVLITDKDAYILYRILKRHHA